MGIKDKILEKINENPGLTLKNLSKEFFKSKGSISNYLKILEEEKMIKKYIQKKLKQ